MKKLFLVITVFITVFAVFTNTKIANASGFSTYAVPIEASLSTEKSSYDKTEVVMWEINLAGGTANFDIYFSDSRGNKYWINDLKSWYTSVNLDYPISGKVTAYITVYGIGKTITDSHTITIK